MRFAALTGNPAAHGAELWIHPPNQIRFPLKTPSWGVSDLALGDGAYSSGLDSSTLLEEHKGVGILRNAMNASGSGVQRAVRHAHGRKQRRCAALMGASAVAMIGAAVVVGGPLWIIAAAAMSLGALATFAGSFPTPRVKRVQQGEDWWADEDDRQERKP